MKRLDPSEDVEKEQRATTKALSVPELLRQTPTNRAEGREINTDSCYAQAASGIFDREDEARKEETESKGGDEERKRAMRHILKANSAPYCY